MSNKPKDDTDQSTHHLLTIKRIPEPLKKLRELLLYEQNSDLFNASSAGKTFEESIGIIAAKLNIALDGWYDPIDLLSMLCNAIEKRATGSVSAAEPHKLHSGLLDVELVEHRDGRFTLDLVEEMETGVVNPATGKFVICDACLESFNCITEDKCLKGERSRKWNQLKNRKLH